MKADTLGRILECIEAKRAVVLATDLESGEQRLLHRGQGDSQDERAHVENALRMDHAITTDADGKPQIFYQPFNPPLRMVLVGAVHIAQPLSVIASLSTSLRYFSASGPRNHSASGIEKPCLGRYMMSSGR